MEIKEALAFHEAAPYVPYNLKLFRETSEKLYRGEKLPPGPDPQASFLASVAWDLPGISFNDAIRILSGDPDEFPESVVRTIRTRAVGRVRGDKVIRLIGKERFIEMAKRYIGEVEKEPGMHYAANARCWATYFNRNSSP